MDFYSKNLMKEMEEVPWANWMNIDDANLRKFGVRGAMARRNRPSPRRSSSGRTSSGERQFPTRKAGKAWRAEHYKRKAILEREKEEQRRREWEADFPEEGEAGWQRREAARKTRKANYRAFRKSLKKRRTSTH
jgi:hypothetical protein